MAYGWSDHVGELELWVQASSETEVFVDALHALNELLGEEERTEAAPEWRELTATGPDRATLLADWLEELVFLAETEAFVPDSVEELVLDHAALRARVGGHRGSPPHLVKAVTYHRLSFEPTDGGWRAHAVLDV